MHFRTIDNGHDDFGGLHRDLAATRAAIDRRGLFRLAARFGAGVGALQLIGCASNPASPSESGGSRYRRRILQRADSRGNAGTVSRRRLEWPQRPGARRRRPQRHPFELRRPERHRRRRAADDRVDDRFRRRRARRWRGAPCTSGTAIAPAATRSTRRASRTRTTCAASRRPTPAARVSFTSIFPGCYAGTMAAHPLRGVSEPRGGDQRRQQDRDLADRAAEGGLRCRVRDRRLREQHRATCRACRSRATWSSATARHSSSLQ